jgi:hypothetical protein
MTIPVWDPEVGDLRRALGGDEQVARLDVAVDDARLVRRGQCVGSLAHNPEGVGAGQPPLPGDQRRQRLAGHQLHDQVRAAGWQIGRCLLVGGGLAVVKDLGDVRMRQRCRVAGLGTEPGPERLVGRVRRREQLDGDGAVEQFVGAAPYFAHAANRYPAGQPVTSAQQVIVHPFTRSPDTP